MKTIFVHVSSDRKSSDAEQTLREIKQAFFAVMREDFLATGMSVCQKGTTLTFDPKNFLHQDVVYLIENSGYNYSNFDGVNFPTKKYSTDGKQSEYYFEKRFEDYDFTVVLNTKTGIIEVSDIRYVDIDNVGTSTSNSVSKKIGQKKTATMDLLMGLRTNSKYKKVEDYSIKNGIIRSDIKLSKFLTARVFVDIRGRIKDYLMIGYMSNKKFIAINHLPLEIAVGDDVDIKQEALKLERTLYGFYQKYNHRVEKALYAK